MGVQSRFLRVAKVLCLGLLLARPVQAVFDPLTIFVSMVGGEVLRRVINYGLEASYEEKEYQKRHEFLKKQTKENFLLRLVDAVQESGNEAILSQYEMYIYPNFIAAIKEVCPDYAEHIKKLKAELLLNYECYNNIRGFEIIRTTVRNTDDSAGLLSFTTDYTYPFNELIEKLHQEVIILEHTKYLSVHAPFKNQSKKFFLAYVTKKMQESGVEAVLSQYELYVYSDFIEALQELCPGYPEHIKKTMSELVINPARLRVMGFETIVRFLPRKDHEGVYDVSYIYPLYELINKLYQQIIALEK